MSYLQQIEAWANTASVLEELLESKADNPWREPFEQAINQSEIKNPWFTRFEIESALRGIIRMLNRPDLEAWIKTYTLTERIPKKVGVIMAGNIPLAGFHDLICVLMSGNAIEARLSSSDSHLLPFITQMFSSYYEPARSLINFTSQIKKVDAIIATGSNNTSRYFEYYFGNLPHVFRKNRNSVAILTGEENEFDLLLLGRDIFTYYGMGCRNISKIFVPEDYRFDELFKNITTFSHVMQHSRYMNNYDYHQALYLMNKREFLTNNFLIVIREEGLSSPVGVLFYEPYNDRESLEKHLEGISDQIQCIVSKKGPVEPGRTQAPAISDYADGFDTMRFLTELS
jgi:hypothetical protein